MTSSTEWLQAFDLEYNNVMANLAAPLDEFEISCFLTKAQELLVTQLYFDKFEGSELNRRCLDALVATKTITKSTTGNFGRLFDIGNDVMYITYEKAKGINLSDPCIGENGKELRVKPVLQDELLKILKNPFKGPSSTTVLRVDAGPDKVELIHSNDYTTIASYTLTYIKKPYPIILFNSTDTIDGYSTPIAGICELDSLLHRIIVTQAVALAAAAYKL